MKNLIDDPQIAAAKRVFPVGRTVEYHPVKGHSGTVSSVIRSAPWRLGSGQIVIMIEGRTGGVSIDHLQLA